eukprot:121838_1
MSFGWITVIGCIISTIEVSSQSITYKKGECEVSRIKKDKCGWFGWGNYYQYTLTPICDTYSSSSQCIYDDSNGKTDCEAWGDYDVNDKRSCWIKYIDNECVACDCTDCDDNAAGTCKFNEGCIDKFTNELVYPKTIKVSDGETLRMKSIYSKNIIYDPNESGKSMIELTGRALCINDICSIPGPSLIVEPGITFHMELENEFDVKAVNYSDIMGPDVTNIHSHGLHISGEQDNIFGSIYPGQTHLITWTIHPQHHLGTNWYHMHHHHSTLLHVMGGMYGALIVDSADNKHLDYDNPSDINDFIIHISWQFLHDNSYCQNCANYNPNTGPRFEFSDNWKLITSLCGLWCNEFSDTQRNDQSGWIYDVMLADGWEINSDVIDAGDYPAFEGFLVNNMYQPYISCINSNEYFKLRIIQASAEIYMQLQFDYNRETDCEYFLIARDGIALRDKSRDLLEKPYYGYFLLPAGGRVDIKVICYGSGSAEIWHREVHPQHKGINESYPMSRINDQLLFKLNIKNGGNSKGTDFSYLDYPEPIKGYPYYIQEVIDQNSYSAGKGGSEYKTGGSKGDSSTDGSKGGSTGGAVQNTEYSECPCSNYNREQTEDILIKETNVCGFEFVEGEFNTSGLGVQDLFEVNGVTFDADRSIFILSKNEMYEFYLKSDGHPVHIHVNPFMIMDDLYDGYVAQKYDWVDTIGYRQYPYDNNTFGHGFKIKYHTRDFIGNVILHCHFLGHEDLGMMAFMKIVDGPTDDLAYCERHYGFQNDYLDAITPMLPNIMPNKLGGKGFDLDYKWINIFLFILIMLTCVLNCYVRYVNKKSYQQAYQNEYQ